MASQEHVVWTMQPGEERRPRIIHGVISVVLLGLAIGLAFIPPLSPVIRLAAETYFATSFRPATAVQVVGGMWFGLWGVIAGTIYPIIMGFVWDEPIAANLLAIPAYAWQSFAAAWAFRRWKRDPRLTRGHDWGTFILVAGLVATIAAAIWGAAIYWILGMPSGAGTWKDFLFVVISETIGHGLAAVVVGAILLKAFSGLIVKSKAFCRGWWA